MSNDTLRVRCTLGMHGGAIIEILDFSPKTSKLKRLPWEPIKLMPLGDIQSGVDSCDLDLLAKRIDRGVREGALFIGMGDYLDVASPSSRAKLKAGGFYDSVWETLDDAMLHHESDLMRILEPTIGRWLGLLEGHHTYEYQNGSTTDINLCRQLGTDFLGSCSMIRLRFDDGNRHSVDCVIWAHHGVGAGVSAAAPVVKLERVVEWADADLYLMGHQHKRAAAAIPRFYMVGNKNPTVVARERLLVGTGSYLKGYMKGSVSGGRKGGTYVEKAMMRPVSLGSPLITIIPTRVVIDGHDTTLIEFEALT